VSERSSRIIDDARLRALRALAAAATDGPWFGPRITDAWPPGELGVYAADDDDTPIPHAIIARMARQGEDTEDGARVLDDEAYNNAAFIAAAHPQVVLAILEQIDVTNAALAEALDLFDAVWCPEHGHAPRPEQLARAEALRKLVRPCR